MSVAALQSFMNMLFEVYNIHGLATLKWSSTKPVVIVASGTLEANIISRYLKKDPSLKHTKLPVVFFLFGTVSQVEPVPGIVIRLNNSIVSKRDETEVADLAFTIYNLMKGPIPNAQRDKDSLVYEVLYGRRYLPFLYLSRTTSYPTLHLAYSVDDGISVLCDDIGSVMKVTRETTFQKQMDLAEVLYSMYQKSAGRLTITLFDTPTARESIDQITKSVSSHVNVVVLFFRPQPDIESFGNEGSDQLVMQSLDDDKGVNSFNSCYVLSSGLGSYSLELVYSNGSNENSLAQTAQQFSDLSWLSVLPSHPKRTSPYPIHISILMQVASRYIDECAVFKPI